MSAQPTTREVGVLIADDHTMFREGLRALLEREPGVRVVAEAADGEEAVEQASRQRPDVAVLDIAMPRLDGIEATRRIRERYSETQVVILSVHGSSEHVYQALRLGAVGYLVKEAAAKQLVEAVKAVVAGQRYLCRSILERIAGRSLASDDLDPRNPLDRLSERERQVLMLVIDGESSRSIGEKLELSPKTIDTYRSRILEKLGARNLPELVRLSIRYGIGDV